MNISGSASANKDIPVSFSEVVNLHETSLPTSQPMNQSAASSFANYHSKSNNGRSGVKIDTCNSNPYSDPSTQDFYTLSLTMPKRLNPYENGLRRLSFLRESLEKQEVQKRKAHNKYGTAAATKLYLCTILLFSLEISVTIPKHRTNMNATFTEQVMNRFYEVNELYDGTINKIHNIFYSTDITTNETFTFLESMEQ